jgi:hypothetical protein
VSHNPGSVWLGLDDACRPSPLAYHAGFALQEYSMLDILLLAIGLGFFVLSIAYTYACDRL